MSHRHWVLVAALGLAGCGGDDTTPPIGNDGGSDALVLKGGTIDLPGCGFKLTTIEGAEKPIAGGTTFGAAPDPKFVHLGFGGQPTTTIAMVWRTDVDTDVTQVKWGVGDALDQRTDGFTYRYVEGIGAGGETERIHEAHLCGLTPDTQYSYQVGGTSGGAEHWSPTYTFRTAPDVTADPTAEVRIATVGDSRDGYDTWQAIAAKIKESGVDLIVFSGDAVSIGAAQSQWDQWFAAAGDVIASVPILSVQGNHELNSPAYYSQFAMPGDEQNFSFDYGHAHMTVLNDTPLDSADLDGSTKTFLEQDLTATDQVWKIVNHHQPMFSSGALHGSNTDLRAKWQPVIDAHHADLVLNGHDHLYMRSKVLNGNNVVNDASLGTVYVVSGGAGAPLYDLEDPAPFFQEIARKTTNYGVVTVNQTTLTVDMFHQDGSPLDNFSISK
jgi:hypothetical protein